ncbi:MAG: hypothetical protein ACP5HZ_02520 [Ferrimicrobium sp.]
MNKTRSIMAGTAVAVLLAGGITAYAVTSGHSTSTATKPGKTEHHTTGAPKSQPASTPKSSTSSPAPSTTTTVGFNASRTVFVLPHHLGDLPAPELAIAKSDPAYASGLLTPSYWEHLDNGGTAVMSSGWFYLGPPSPSVGAIKAKMSLTGEISDPSGVVPTIQKTSVPIVSYQLRDLAFSSSFIGLQGYAIIGPTNLEVRVAPIGTLTINGVAHSAFCVPQPIADLQNGKIVTPPTWPTITAGPAVIAPAPGLDVWVQGAPSCAGFH